MVQYWLVGATWGGTENALPEFILRGYWYCWDVNSFPGETGESGNSVATQQSRFKQIKKEDRVAVKRLLGKGSSEMSILALGIVKDVDLKEWRIYVDWLDADLVERRVPLKGCVSAIHGPFVKASSDRQWIHEVFCL